MSSQEDPLTRGPELLLQAATRTFEELYFLTVEPAEADLLRGASLITFAVRFVGPHCGTLAVTMPDNLTATIVANLLGTDEAVETWIAHDTAGEFANVVCGHILPDLFGAGDVYRIDAPHLLPPGSDRGTEVASASMNVEGNLVEISLCLAA